MKKRSLKVFACVAALTMAFSLCACSKSSSDDDSDSKTKTSSEEKQSEKKSDKEYASMQEYAESDEIKEEVETVNASLEPQGITVSVRSEGDKIIYTYKCTTISKADADAAGLAESLKAELDAQKSTLETTVSLMKTKIDVDEPVAVMEYVSSDDQIIVSEEYAAN